MAATERPSTPPPAAINGRGTSSPRTPRASARNAPTNLDATPEHVRRLEMDRLKAKHNQQEANRDLPLGRPQKRQRMDENGRLEIDASVALPVRQSERAALEAAEQVGGAAASDAVANTRVGGGQAQRKRREIPSLVQSSYIEYDLSKMKDSKGGFMVDSGGQNGEGADGEKMETWQERQQRRLEESRRLNPPIAADPSQRPLCFECSRPELDFQFLQVFGARVCHACKQANPDKYSLLTKTECKNDYLLTDPELKDEELMPHLLKPNPHNTTYSSMMLYLRYQVEEFAFKKWGGGDGLDAEYERRTEEKKKKKDKKFEQKLKDLRRRTRTAKFSKAGARRLEAKHVHNFQDTALQNDEGLSVRVCECGMQSEEITL
ncbi:DNA repair protein rad14 [Savitreella phatthalungensis]